MSGNTIWKASRLSRIIKSTVEQLERELVSTSSSTPHLHGQVVHDRIGMETNSWGYQTKTPLEDEHSRILGTIQHLVYAKKRRGDERKYTILT